MELLGTGAKISGEDGALLQLETGQLQRRLLRPGSLLPPSCSQATHGPRFLHSSKRPQSCLLCFVEQPSRTGALTMHVSSGNNVEPMKSCL